MRRIDEQTAAHLAHHESADAAAIQRRLHDLDREWDTAAGLVPAAADSAPTRIRAAREIERERYAIKALRGDFDSVPAREADDVQQRVRAAIAAVDA